MEDSQECGSSSTSSNLLSFPNGVGCCSCAEERIQEILRIIQPTVASEEKRMEIIDYIRELIRGYYGTEVFLFGSVPLKTYLPDGDIDLTAPSYQNMEEDFARGICNFLEGEAQSDSRFQVADIQYIHAQVKIVKCTVQNIAVDISFNQMAGLCALCFLEQADQLIGKDHLFKRSVILIKAWCYYESRILGAHHGLVSTYALETMVLHIINLFHRLLHGPLAVLHRFLSYYSTFNWEALCVGITGPVAISSLPEVSTVKLENLGDELLFSEEFLRYCRETFTIPTDVQETKIQEFPIKHLNIMDPLKFSNNLGRSVTKGNFYRIRLAFSFGAEKLGGILMLPREIMIEELTKFFVNTLQRNGRGKRADVEASVPEFGSGLYEASDLEGDCGSYFSGGIQYDEWNHGYAQPSATYLSSLYLSSEVSNRTTSNGKCQLMQYDRNDFSQGNTEVFLPRQPSFHSQVFQLPNLAFASEGKTVSFGFPYMGVEGEVKPQETGMYIPDVRVVERVSRGTGTFFPDVYWYHARKNPQQRVRNPESACHGMFRKWPEKKDEVKASRTVKNENGSNLNLSLEEFPHLPGSKTAVTQQIPLSLKPTLKAPLANDVSHSMGQIKFRTLSKTNSALGSPSQVASKQPEPGGSLAGDSSVSVPSMRLQGPKELHEAAERKMVPSQPFELNDDKDFPPLCNF